MAPGAASRPWDRLAAVAARGCKPFRAAAGPTVRTLRPRPLGRSLRGIPTLRGAGRKGRAHRVRGGPPPPVPPHPRDSMRPNPSLPAAALLAALALSACASATRAPVAGAGGAEGAARAEFSVPIEYYTLANGLRVVLSPDRTAPTA